MPTPTQGEHAQTELAHELFAAAQLAPGEGIEDAVSRIAAALTAATAQPAPQGVAYAELPVHDSDSICAWSVWWTHNKSKFTTPRQASNAAWAAAIASHGQAPAGASHERALEEVMRERDEADDFIDTLLDEVLGADRSEWSSAYGHADALEEVRERITALHKPAVDRAWAQFQAATQQADARVTVSVGSQEFDLAETGAHFTTADMATACGQAFREGQATPTAQAAPAAGAVAGPITDNPKPGEKYWDISGGLAREQIWQGLSPEWDLLDAGLLFWNEADAVAALSIPASTVVSEPEDVQRARIIAAIAQRWIGDRTHLGALVYLDDLAWALKTLAAAPTPAAQADSQPALTPETASAMVEGMDMNDRVLAAIDAETMADSVLEDAARLLRQILAASQDGDSDTHLSAHFVSRIETITKPGGAA